MNLTVILSAAFYMGAVDITTLLNDDSSNMSTIKEIGLLLNKTTPTPVGWFGNPLDVLFIFDGSKMGNKYKIVNLHISNESLNKLNDTANLSVENWTNRFENLVQNLIFEDVNHLNNLNDNKSNYENEKAHIKIRPPGPNFVTSTPKEGILTNIFKSILNKFPSPINIYNNAKVGVQNVLSKLPGFGNKTEYSIDPDDIIERHNHPQVTVYGQNKNVKQMEEVRDKEKNDTLKKNQTSEFLDSTQNVDNAVDLDSETKSEKNNENVTANGDGNAGGKVSPGSKDDESNLGTRIVGGSSSLKYTPIQNKFRGDNSWGWGL